MQFDEIVLFLKREHILDIKLQLPVDNILLQFYLTQFLNLFAHLIRFLFDNEVKNNFFNGYLAFSLHFKRFPRFDSVIYQYYSLSD